MFCDSSFRFDLCGNDNFVKDLNIGNFSGELERSVCISSDFQSIVILFRRNRGCAFSDHFTVQIHGCFSIVKADRDPVELKRCQLFLNGKEFSFLIPVSDHRFSGKICSCDSQSPGFRSRVISLCENSVTVCRRKFRHGKYVRLNCFDIACLSGNCKSKQA